MLSPSLVASAVPSATACRARCPAPASWARPAPAPPARTARSLPRRRIRGIAPARAAPELLATVAGFDILGTEFNPQDILALILSAGYIGYNVFKGTLVPKGISEARGGGAGAGAVAEGGAEGGEGGGDK